jgi:hypothetical protein
VDGVVTIDNYTATALSPFSTCRDFNGVESHSICRDWWRKDRVYLCERDGDWNFDDTKRRVNSIYSSADSSSGNMYYTDLRKNEDGSWTTEGNTVSLGSIEEGSFGNCDRACKTRRKKADTQAGMSETTAQYQKDVTSYDFLYRKCNDDTCPAGPGEEIIESCRCLNEFTGAASLMSTLDSAGKDLICSSGVRR